MGNYNSFFGLATKSIPETRVLVLGLDAAGKTTLLYHLKLNEVVPTAPTIGACSRLMQRALSNESVWGLCLIARAACFHTLASQQVSTSKRWTLDGRL